MSRAAEVDTFDFPDTLCAAFARMAFAKLQLFPLNELS